MEFAGAAFSISPLLTTCSTISTVLLNVGKRFRRTPLMMTSIGTECNLIHVALSQVWSFEWSSVSGYTNSQLEQMTRAIESIILGCQLTLSVIEEYAIELQDYVEGLPLSPTEQMGIMARVQVLWKEEEMRELLLQLRGYQSGLMGLIRAAHDSDFSDSQDDFAASNYATLLQRSRSSRVRKPLSIRAAMQQAATYSNLTRSTTSDSSRTSKSDHSATLSTSTIQSRQSSTPSSISQSGSNQCLSAVKTDFCDGAAPTTPGSKPTSEAARRRRPTALALQPEEASSTVVDGRNIHSKPKKDQLRRSSPTVGQNFRFVPGEPPSSGLPPIPPSKDDDANMEPGDGVGKTHGEQIDLPLEPLSSPPPTAPLPKPPSRSPSRSRSPPKVPKIPTRAPSRISRASPRNGYMDRQPVSAPSSHQVTSVEEEPKHQHEPERKENAVSQCEAKTMEEYPETGDGQSQPATPPARSTPISQSPVALVSEPRKQKSSSSMRSLIIGLPETARLRKKASAEALRKQTSTERLYIRPEIEEDVPALPVDRVVGLVRSNTFGQQSHSSIIPPPRTSSIEGLSEQNCKRSVTELGNDTRKSSLSLRDQRGMARCASDARRPPHPRFPAPRRQDGGNCLSPPASASLSSSSNSFGSPLSQEPTSALSDSWPLTPENGYISDNMYFRGDASQHKTQFLQTGSDHSRNTSSERSFAPSGSTSRTLSVSSDQTPKASRSNTPYSSTPRTGRSRNNTLMSIPSETVAGEMVDDGVSTAGSVAPSVMSAQWFRTSRELLGLGTRMSRAAALPWEDTDVPCEESGSPVPPKPKTPPAKASRKDNGVGNIFSIFPPRAPSRMMEKEERFIESPPRSPLLTPSFLSNVQTTLTQDMPTKTHVTVHLPQTSTSIKSGREGASTPEWSRTGSIKSTKEQRNEKKKKKKENSRFPTLGDMVKEYKAMTAIRYTSTYAQAAEEQRIEKEIRKGNRPATSSTGATRLGASISLDVQISSPTTTGSNSVRSKSLRTIPSNLRPSTGSTSSHTATINESSSHRLDHDATHLQSDGRCLDATDDAAARKQDDKKKAKDSKKSSVFPTVKEIWKTSHVATPHSRWS